MDFRIEKDSMGEVKVSSDKPWGAQTERSRQNFRIGGQLMPTALVQAIVLVKKCAAVANWKANKLDKEKKEAIVCACDKLINFDSSEFFPLVVWQTGSGTQTNMNVNEVIAHLSDGVELHPNDDVNMSQSTNDVFPTALHVASVITVERKLIPILEKLILTIKRLEGENAGLMKVGRTHLQDATPIPFSSELSGWRAMLSTSEEMIKSALPFVKRLAVGGTAVGTGLNAPKAFAADVVSELRKETNVEFCEDENKFHALSSRDALCNLHGALKSLAVNLMKLANDVRWLASGPRAGLHEITIPENEPGSSIMPGKVNPTQCEALTMVATEIIGNDVTVGVACSQGNFELNVFMPVIGFKMLESINLLSDAMDSFDKHCMSGLKANGERMSELLENSLMLATALSPIIGYEDAAKLVKLANEKGLSLFDANAILKLVDENKLRKIINEQIKM